MRFVELVTTDDTRIKLNTAHIVAVHASRNRVKSCCVVTTMGCWDVRGDIAAVTKRIS